MTRPRFSILIPTRDRPDTFVHALATVVAQSGNDFEIVVADNASQKAVKQAVDSVTTCPIVYVRSDEILSLTDNWLNGLASCSGEYITILGDDDGLMPTALDIARRALEIPGISLLTWLPNNYFWPNMIIHQWAGFLSFRYTNSLQGMQLNSRDIMKAYWSGDINHEHLPMLYNSFVHRSLLEHTQARWGSMIPLPHSPDVYSGLFNLCLVDSFFSSLRPLSFRGASGSSIGTANLYPKLGKKINEKTLAEEGLVASNKRTGSWIPMHQDLCTGEGKGPENFAVHMVNLKLIFHDYALPGDEELKINIPRLITEILDTINRHPDNYKTTLAYAQDLATKYNLTIDPAIIPKLNLIGDEPPTLRPGLTQLNQVQWLISIDGKLSDITDINMACRLAESMLPPLD